MSEFDYEHQDGENWPEDWENEKSKSQVKRELLALRELGKQLISLPKRDLDKLDLPEDIYDAVLKAQSMSKGALKRQTGFIGGLMAEYEHEEIARKLELLKQPHQGQVKQFHQLEEWRDRLLEGDDSVYGELISEFTDFDVQHIRQLVRNAQREAKQNKPPKSARLVFQYLQQLQQNQ
jgi:ribosome-associated protein